jgi:hypothetical protein
MITCQGTTQARKSNEHVSISTQHRPRHEPIRACTCPPCKTGNRRRKPGVASVGRLPPRAAAGLAVRAISMVVRDHASLVTNRDHNLASTTVVNSSQRRTCATMLALTSHYMATNAKHPRYAPACSRGWQLTVIGRGVTGCEKRFAANLGLRSVCGLAGARSAAWLASGFARVGVGGGAGTGEGLAVSTVAGNDDVGTRSRR